MFILLKDNLSSRFSGFEILAMILAAAMHDVAHPGVTNPYLRSCNVRNITYSHLQANIKLDSETCMITFLQN